MIARVMFIAAAIAAVAPCASSAQESGADAQSVAMIEQIDRALQAGRLDEAESLLNVAEAQPATDAHDMLSLLQAELAMARGRPDAAARALAALDSDRVAPCRVALVRGGVDISAGRHAEAVTALAGATVLCPDDAMLWRWRARAERGTGRYADALLSLRSADARAPGNPAVLNDLAVALMDMGEPGEATAVLDRAIALSPADHGLIRNRAFAEGMLGNPPLRLTGESPPAWSDRLEAAGDGAMKLGKAKLAKALYAEAMIQNPNHSPDLLRRYRAIESVK